MCKRWLWRNDHFKYTHPCEFLPSVCACSLKLIRRIVRPQIWLYLFSIINTQGCLLCVYASFNHPSLSSPSLSLTRSHDCCYLATMRLLCLYIILLKYLSLYLVFLYVCILSGTNLGCFCCFSLSLSLSFANFIFLLLQHLITIFSPFHSIYRFHLTLWICFCFFICYVVKIQLHYEQLILLLHLLFSDCYSL